MGFSEAISYWVAEIVYFMRTITEEEIFNVHFSVLVAKEQLKNDF
jgi:hypothetical protein